MSRTAAGRHCILEDGVSKAQECTFLDVLPHLLYTTQMRKLHTMARCPVLMQCLKAVLSLDGTLSNKETERRTQFLLFCGLGMSTCIVGISLSWDMHVSHPAYMAGTLLAIGGLAIGVLEVLCKVPLTTPIVVGPLFSLTTGILLWDLDARTVSYTQWPLLVLVIDMLLVMRVPTMYSLGLVGVIVMWLWLMAVEQSFRFGLFDLPGLPKQGGEHGRLDYVQREFGCEKLPCPMPFLSPAVFAAVAVFVLDFIVTRGFAREVLTEQASMERTINAVQDIASLLARYDVEKVAELLEEHEHELPVGMTVALRALEKNLRSYKAYLPKTCLLGDEAAGGEDEISEYESETQPLSSCSTVSSPIHESVVRHIALGLTSVKATLLTVNIKDTLRLVEQDSAHFSSFFTTLLLKTLKATESHRGMVDVFVGDRVHCSFNTSRQCANHATSALHTATMLLQDSKPSQVNIGVASGKVLRGDMGCAVMRRFSMVGTLVRDVHGMERAGRILGCDVLCNRMCFSDAECEHEMRLIPCKVEVSATSDTPEVVAELLLDNEQSDHATEEWMYQIGKNSEWENYNITVRKYLKGDVSAAAVEEAAQGCPCERSPLNVHPSTVKGGLLSVALARPLRDKTTKDDTGSMGDMCADNVSESSL